MLRLLLDEHISPKVAQGLRRRIRELTVLYFAEWEGGTFLGLDDAMCLDAAYRQGLTLVTFDRRTIPPLLKAWAETGRKHGGVIFVDEKTISPANIGGLVLALAKLAKETVNLEWTNRIYFVHR
ncbi:MAG TPA: DUF5615 family PIN-like protein [Candidatus Sulfotelmatobacter sp.]